MENFIVTVSGPMVRDMVLKSSEEFYNQCHNPSDGTFCEADFPVTNLQTGDPRQRRAFTAIKNLGVLETLKDHDPAVISTVPLGVYTDTSDIDILFEAKNVDAFQAKVTKLYGHHEGFSSRRSVIDGLDTVVTNFNSNRESFELFAQSKPVKKQTAYLHHRVEDALLKIGGEKARKDIIKLKESGLKTEPAFAKYFGIPGENPYKALMELADLPISDIRAKISKKEFSLEEFYNQCHNPSDGTFCEGNGGFSPKVKSYLKNQYQMDSNKARELGLSADGTKLLIPFKDEKGKTTSVKWRDTAVLEGPGRWGGSPPSTQKDHGLSVYENKTRTGPLFVVESPSEGLILAAKNKRVIFFDGADSLVSRDGQVINKQYTRLSKLVKGQDSILIPDNDVRGEVFAKTVEPLVSRRINPPEGFKDLRQFLTKGNGDLDQLVQEGK